MVFVNDIKDTFLDFPDNESLAVIVFFEGCSHNCPGCHNYELQHQSFKHKMYWEDLFNTILSRCKRNMTDKVVLSGGDPFFDAESRQGVLKLIDALERADIEVCAYTGYSASYVENLYSTATADSSLVSPSYIKCGPFNINSLNNEPGKTDEMFVLASSNQNFYRRVENSNLYKCISTGGVLLF